MAGDQYMRGWNEHKYIQSLNTFFRVCQLYVFMCASVFVCVHVSPQLEVFNEC